MGEDTGGRRGVLRRATTFVKGRPTTQKVGGGVAAALLASAPFGGLSAVPDQGGPGQVRLDEAIQVGPFRVVIDQVVELPDLEPAVRPEPGQRVLVLDATVTNTTDRPDYGTLLHGQLSLSGGGVRMEDRPTLVVVDDSTTVSTFNPGVEYRLAIAYTTDGPWQGDSVTLTVDRLEFVVEDRLTLDDNAWRPRDGVQWQGTLPVVRKS